MIEATAKAIESRSIAVKLYDRWVRQRQGRHGLEIPTDGADLKRLGLKNFANQLAVPRQRQLKDLKEVANAMSPSDAVALLVMTELPPLEISSLLHKLTRQLTTDPEATYFSKVNQDDNCGCGCGCGCAAMASLPYEERIYVHYAAKPYSIDPFDEAGLPHEHRDALLISDFLKSYDTLAQGVAETVNQRYFRMGQQFG